MTIIVREVYQDPSQVGQLSFPSKGFERVQPHVGGRIFKRESDYTTVARDDAELAPEESPSINDEADNEE